MRDLFLPNRRALGRPLISKRTFSPHGPGYVIGGAVATSAWNYPNRNLYNNFDEFDSMNDNYAMLEKAQVHPTVITTAVTQRSF